MARKRTPVHSVVTYQSGCEECVGLAVKWTGSTAKLKAEYHKRTTGHKGIWFTSERRNTYDITDPLTMDEWSEMEKRAK